MTAMVISSCGTLGVSLRFLSSFILCKMRSRCCPHGAAPRVRGDNLGRGPCKLKRRACRRGQCGRHGSGGEPYREMWPKCEQHRGDDSEFGGHSWLGSSPCGPSKKLLVEAPVYLCPGGSS